MSKVQWWVVDSDQHDQRLDNFLVSRLKGVPRSKLYSMIRTGELRVNKGRKKPSYRLRAGDHIRVPPLRLGTKPPSSAINRAEPSVLTQQKDWVIFEDAGLLVVNKPSGLAVHGGSGLSYGLIEWLRARHGARPYLELVHRLDKGTSGVVLVAKKASVLKSIQAQMRAQSICKRYHAVLGATPSAERVRVAHPLLKNVLRSGEREVRIDPDGKPSETWFRVVCSLPGGLCLVEVSPLTGRTHQIRVHAQSIGCAIVNDDKYGDRHKQVPARRLMLHASAYELEYAGERRCFNAPLPQAFERCFPTAVAGVQAQG